MLMLVWKDTFDIGVKQFDEQHKHLVGLLNRAYNDFIAGAPSERVESILNELATYSAYHFEAEESWMNEQSYPMLGELRVEHGRFLETLIDMLNGNDSDRKFLLKEVFFFLHDWLICHIHKSVADYSRYSAAINK